MKVINLKPGDSVLIGDNIVVQLQYIHWPRVTLGLQAPRDILILREELAVRAADAGCPRQPSGQTECGICNNPGCTDPGGKH